MRKDTRLGETRVTKEKILRSVASSTAIETGESTRTLEKRLANKQRRFPELGLAE